MEHENQSSKVLVILRWIAFLPGAFLTAWLAWFLVALLNRITMGMSGIDPNSFMTLLINSQSRKLVITICTVRT